MTAVSDWLKVSPVQGDGIIRGEVFTGIAAGVKTAPWRGRGPGPAVAWPGPGPGLAGALPSPGCGDPPPRQRTLRRSICPGPGRVAPLPVKNLRARESLPHDQDHRQGPQSPRARQTGANVMAGRRPKQLDNVSAAAFRARSLCV